MAEAESTGLTASRETHGEEDGGSDTDSYDANAYQDEYENEHDDYRNGNTRTLYRTKSRARECLEDYDPLPVSLASLDKTTPAYKAVSKRISFGASGIHFESLKTIENRNLMGKLRKRRKRLAKKKKRRRKKKPKKRGFRPVKTLPSPGPSTYTIKDSRMFGHSLNKYSGIFNTSNPKSEIDWTMYFASQTPGPNAYPRPEMSKINGGRFNESRPKSYTEWIVYRSKQLPGPSDYEPAPIPLPKGGRISSAKLKSEIDWIQYFAKDTPSSAEYPAPPLPKIGGGRFNSGNGKSEIEWVMYYNKDTPGPATYGMLPNPKIGGGRFNESRPKTPLEWVVYRSKDIPGPAKYSPPRHARGDYFDTRPRTAPLRSPWGDGGGVVKKPMKVSRRTMKGIEDTVRRELYSPTSNR